MKSDMGGYLNALWTYDHPYHKPKEESAIKQIIRFNLNSTPEHDHLEKIKCLTTRIAWGNICDCKA